MKLLQPRLTLCLAVLVPLVGGLAGAFSTGPTQPATGAPPGEPSCADVACHTSFAVNSGSGGLVLSVLTSTPGQYRPGDTLDFGIHLQQVGQSRWGFQLTVINSAGVPVGTILVADPARTHAETGQGGRQYLTHTAPGTDSGTVDASPGWTFKWKAPSAGAGAVTFYAAGNAANGDGTSFGDYIYTTSAVFTEAPASVAEPGTLRPGSTSLSPNYPNPFNAGTRLHYVLEGSAAGPVSLAIHDINGRLVRTLLSNSHSGAGDHWIDWDGRDRRGLSAPSGTYLVRLTTRAGSDTRKALLLR